MEGQSLSISGHSPPRIEPSLPAKIDSYLARTTGRRRCMRSCSLGSGFVNDQRRWRGKMNGGFTFTLVIYCSSISFAKGQTTDSRLLKLLNRRRPPQSLAEGRSLFDARVSNQLVSAGWPPTPCPRLPRLGSLCVRAVRAVVRRRDIRKRPYFADLTDWCRRGRGLTRGRGTLWAPQG